MIEGITPSITNGFNPGKHDGVDFFYSAYPAINGSIRTFCTVNAVKGKWITTGDKWFNYPGSMVYAVDHGVVSQSEAFERGWCVKVDHGGGITTVYRHMVPTCDTPEKGEEIQAGRILGFVGYDPKDAEKLGHLHWEVLRDGAYVDPAPYWSALKIKTTGKPFSEGLLQATLLVTSGKILIG